MLLLALAAAVSPAPRATAQATIRIVEHAKVTEARWRTAPRRTERLVRDENGRLTRLRLIEHE